MKKTYFLGLILFIAILVFTMVMVGCLGCFFDVASLLMVLLSCMFMLIANFSLADIGKYFALGFRKDAGTPAELRKGILFFNAFQKYLILSGIIGMMMGLVAMLSMIEEPEAIGAGMALALITVLYAVFFSMAVAIPLKTGLEKKLIESEA